MAVKVNDGNLLLPPGFHFHPSDDELVTHYLLRKCTAAPLPVPVIAELDLYKFDPWQLPEKALYGEKEWYFFSPRDRKYPNGSRPNRAAGNGYWKATGADKPIGSPKTVAIKKALVFYAGKAPNGEKTNWIMHEYRLADVDRSARKKNSGLRLDDWVLCRIYHKKGALGKQTNPDRKAASGGPRRTKPAAATSPEPKPEVVSPPHPSRSVSPRSTTTEYICFGSSNTRINKWNGDSSSDEQEMWPDLACGDREVESQPRLEMAEGQRRKGVDWGQVVESNLDQDVALGFGFVPFSPFLFDSFDDICQVFNEVEMDEIYQF